MNGWTSLLLLTGFVSLVGLQLLLIFALRLGSLAQLEQVCRERRRLNRLTRILQARRPVLLALEFLLPVVLVVGTWSGAELGLLTTFRPPESAAVVPVTAWLCRVCGMLLVLFLVWIAIPRAVARARGGVLLYRSRSLLDLLRRVTIPLWSVANRVDRLIHRTVGLSEPAQTADQTLISDILTLVDEGHRHDMIWAGSSRMIHGLLDLHETDVSSVMTPRIDLVSVPAGLSLVDAMSFVTQHRFSRYPVVRDRVDDVTGVLYVKDLLAAVADQKLQNRTVEDIARQAVYVPESQPVDSLIDEMQQKKIQLAVVVDEYSGVAGIVTMEDIMEEIVGEIADEFDADVPSLVRQLDGAIEAAARAHIDDLNDQFQLGLPEVPEYDTLNGFLLSEFGRIPATGESHQWRGIRLTVLEADERQLKRVRLEVLEPASETATLD